MHGSFSALDGGGWWHMVDGHRGLKDTMTAVVADPLAALVGTRTEQWADACVASSSSTEWWQVEILHAHGNIPASLGECTGHW
jgi:hypothetical protein